MADNSERSRSTRVEARRSQRVMLRIPILVRAEIEGEAPLEEDTFTQVVNAHGALIALAMKVRPGQKLVLRNWGTAKEKPCRVIHVKEAEARSFLGDGKEHSANHAARLI